MLDDTHTRSRDVAPARWFNVNRKSVPPSISPADIAYVCVGDWDTAVQAPPEQPTSNGICRVRVVGAPCEQVVKCASYAFHPTIEAALAEVENCLDMQQRRRKSVVT